MDTLGILFLIIFFAPPALVLVINTFAFFIKEPVNHYTSKQLFGYISGFMLPVNYLISFLTVVICNNFGMGAQPAFLDVTDQGLHR